MTVLGIRPRGDYRRTRCPGSFVTITPPLPRWRPLNPAGASTQFLRKMMTGPAPISSRWFLFLWLILWAKLRSDGLAAAIDKPVLGTATGVTANTGSGQQASPSEWPLPEIARGAAVSTAIVFIKERWCSDGRCVRLSTINSGYIVKLQEQVGGWPHSS